MLDSVWEEERSLTSRFHICIWKMSFGLISNLFWPYHAHNKSKCLPKRNPPIQTSITMQSVVSDAYDNFNFIKTNQKPPAPNTAATPLRITSKTSGRIKCKVNLFIFRREVLRLWDLMFSRKFIGSELKPIFPRLNLV